MTPVRHALPIALTMGIFSQLTAQSLDCVPDPAGCTQTVPAGTKKVTFQVRTTGTTPTSVIQNVIVIGTTDEGVVSPVVSGNTGIAAVVWEGIIAPGQTIRIALEAEMNSITHARTLYIQARDPLGRMLEIKNDSQSTSTGLILPRALQVYLDASRKPCAEQRVYFAPSAGGTVSPDTAYGTAVAGGKCVAEATWRLGPAVGEQTVWARLVEGTDRRSFNAVARARPKLSGGLVWSAAFLGEGNDDAMTVTKEIGKYQYTEIDPGSGREITITRDTVLSQTTSQIETPNFDPIVGIEFTVFPTVRETRRIRFFAGVSATAPTERFFAGIAPIALFSKQLTEGSAIGLYVGTSLYRAKTTDGRKNIWSWPSAMLVVDGTSLLSAVAGAFKTGS